tara:strand:+ start:1164 stop:2198 length:1035 start_codon:yes stop_codon:yes gene_type:complete
MEDLYSKNPDDSSKIILRNLFRFTSWSIFILTLIFLINNYLIFWHEWPGLLNFFKNMEWFGLQPLRQKLNDQNYIQGWIQFIILIFAIISIMIYSYINPRKNLRIDAQFFEQFAAYITRACFWAVLLVGIVDVVISFLRVEDLLMPLFGENVAKELGRSVYRGTFIHYPLVVIGFVIAIFVRTLGFTWLSLLVVIAEFQIVISRFVYSYEQAFMGDLVRMWYAGLFLFASAYALISEGHVRVDVFYTKFTKKRKAVSNSIGSMILGIPLCLVILGTGMWGKGSSLNSPLLSFEVYQQGFGMYVKYIMVGFLIVFALSMLVQFIGYFLSNVAIILDEEEIPQSVT